MREFYAKNYFLLKRLHSLLGIIPVGAFFLVHMLLNSRAGQSPEAYQWVPDTLDQVPFIWAVEFVFIILPILFHGILGWVIIWQGDPNSHKPPLGWYANWAYTMQRWTGGILFFLLLWHLATTWWAHMEVKIGNALQGTQHEFDIYGLMASFVGNPIWLIVFGLFVLIAAYHFGNGIFNFCYKWGITSNTRAQRWAIVVGLFFGLIGVWWGFASLWGLRFAPWAAEYLATIRSFLLAGH